MTTEAMRALDEIETQLTGADGWLTKIEGDDREQMMALGHHNVKQALRLLPTLRAALAAPGDGEIEAIRARAVTWPGGLDPNSPLTPFGEACNDRATLLDRDARHVAEIARLSAELAAERVRRVEVERVKAAIDEALTMACDERDEAYSQFDRLKEAAGPFTWYLSSSVFDDRPDDLIPQPAENVGRRVPRLGDYRRSRRAATLTKD